MRRQRRTKIVATLGPASGDKAIIGKLFAAGADVFRINMSHTSHDSMRELVAAIRAVEAENNRPIGILVDLQGPKLRLGAFKNDSAEPHQGSGVCVRHRSCTGRRHPCASAARRNLRRHQAGRCPSHRRRQAAPAGDGNQPAAHRRARRRRRQSFEPQRREPPRHRDSAGGTRRQKTLPISKRRWMPVSTGWRSRSFSAPRTSPRPRRSHAAAPQ